MDLIAFYADNALIKKATSAEETPTPGYLYHEIVGITHKSVEACQNLENMLLSRLENDSPIVKLKTLRTIKHILLKGHASVKRDLMSRASSISPCIHVRGTADPLRGDALWESVRTEAQDVMQVLFDTEAQRAVPTPVAVSGIGSDNLGARVGFNTSSSNISSSGGFQTNSNGSTSLPNNGNPKYNEVASNYKSSNAHSSYTNYPAAAGPGGYGGHATNSSSSGGYNGVPFTQDIKNKISSFVNKPTNELSNFGSVASVSHAASHSHSTAGAGADWAYTPPAAVSTLDSSKLNGGSEEAMIVDDITNGAVTSTISFQALDQFCVRCALLDQFYVADLLFKKLESRTWQVRHKALSVIEALLLSSTGSVIRERCIEQRGYVEVLLNAIQGATRDKAKQVLTLLGVSIDPVSGTPTPLPVSPPTPRANEALVDPTTTPAAASSLFAGLSIGPSLHSPASTPAPATPVAPAYTPPAISSPTSTAPPLINIIDDDSHNIMDDHNERNTSLLTFLEASAKHPPSPSPLRELAHTAPPNESDDSPLIAPLSPTFIDDALSLSTTIVVTNPPPRANLLVDLGLEVVPPSPDILAKFRTPLNASTPIIPSQLSNIEANLSSSSPVSPPSFLERLMESPLPSSLAELLETPETAVLSPSVPQPPTATSGNASPFGAPAKVPMVAKPLKPAPATIPHHNPNLPPSLFPHHAPMLTSAYPPTPTNTTVSPNNNIRTTSSTSMFNPIYSVPRAPASNPLSPQTAFISSSPTSISNPNSNSASTSSSFNFVQPKKQDHFGDLVSIQIKQMSSK